MSQAQPESPDGPVVLDRPRFRRAIFGSDRLSQKNPLGHIDIPHMDDPGTAHHRHHRRHYIVAADLGQSSQRQDLSIHQGLLPTDPNRFSASTRSRTRRPKISPSEFASSVNAALGQIPFVRRPSARCNQRRCSPRYRQQPHQRSLSHDRMHLTPQYPERSSARPQFSSCLLPKERA